VIQRVRQMRHRRPPRTLFLLHVVLREVKPTIWRRLAVAGALSLHQLHIVLQIVMGWEYKHLYSFTVGDREYEDPQGDDRDSTSPDPRKTQLDSLALQQGSAFLYTYDFGDDWEHDIVVEGIAPLHRFAAAVTLLGGERACPPEDCGGPHGYLELLEVLRDPKAPGAWARLDWMGQFDPDELDLRRIARRLGPPRSRAV
jgi:Plasmid pRiA4b ORF-3-like protein